MTAPPEVGMPGPGVNQSDWVTVSQCAAIIVSWQPDMSVLERLMRKLQQQGVDVLVVDNGSDNQSDILSRIDHHKGEASCSTNNLQIAAVSCLPLSENIGLAAGMNQGLSWAAERGYQFVWLFDQDSDLSEGFCENMLSAWREGGERTNKLAALGPRLVDPVSRRRTPFRHFRLRHRSDSRLPGTTDLFSTDFLISSGTLLSMSALQDIGPMKAAYFIDNIDLEWCFRARSLGWQLLGCDRAELWHRIGEASRNPLVTQGIMVSHGPLRYYYSTRNRIHLRKQAYAPADWVWRDHVRFLIKTAFLILADKRRSEYWRALWQARRDSRSLS